jgi:hypothetical protein
MRALGDVLLHVGLREEMHATHGDCCNPQSASGRCRTKGRGCQFSARNSCAI